MASLSSQKWAPWVLLYSQLITYGKTLRLELFYYLADEKIMARSKARLWPVVRWVNLMLLLKSARRFAVIHYAERVLSKLIRRDVQFPRLWSKLDGALFCFCVNRTADRYHTDLKKLPLALVIASPEYR